MADFIGSGNYDRHIRRMRTRYRRRRDVLVDALAGFDVGIRGLSAGLQLLLTLPDGAEQEVLRRAGEAGVALSGLALLRHPLAGPEIPETDGGGGQLRRTGRARVRRGGRCAVPSPRRPPQLSRRIAERIAFCRSRIGDHDNCTEEAEHSGAMGR